MSLSPQLNLVRVCLAEAKVFLQEQIGLRGREGAAFNLSYGLSLVPCNGFPVTWMRLGSVYDPVLF